jgi:Sep15/SelM redox domain
LNKLPELKSFLKDGEAASYEGVSVRFVHGQTAVMTIFDDGVEQEKVPLHTIKSKQTMHSLMKEKGFVLKSAEQLATILAEHKQQNDALVTARQKQLEERQRRREELEKRRKDGSSFLFGKKPGQEKRLREREDSLGKAREEREKRGHSSPLSQSPPYQTMSLVFGALGLSLIVVIGSSRRRKRKASRKPIPTS